MCAYPIQCLIIAAALLAPSAMAFAADEDRQVWSSVNASTNLGSRGVLSLEGQVRLTDDASRFGQFVLRPSIGFKLNPNTTLSLGYAYGHSDPIGPGQINEHRIWQQMSYPLISTTEGVTVTGRSRLEQRWIEGASDMGWRYRQQLRLTAPLSNGVRAVAWSELFLSLDDTRWGQNSGLDRWRNALGISVPIHRAITIEPSYIHQRISRPGQDRVNRIGNLTMTATF